MRRFARVGKLVGGVASVCAIFVFVACGDTVTDGEGGAAGSGGSPAVTTGKSTASAIACVPGSQIQCACVSGQGVQACLPDGSGYGPCQNQQGTCNASTTNGSTTGSTNGSTVATGTTAATTVVTSGGTTVAGATTTVTTGGPVACDDIGQCGGDGITPDSGCLECSVLGDTTSFTDGGTCLDEYTACFGNNLDCVGGAGVVACCNLNECMNDCDLANPNDDAGFWSCACGTFDSFSCDPAFAPLGTCFGDDTTGAGYELYYGTTGWVTCVFDTCAISCQ